MQNVPTSTPCPRTIKVLEVQEVGAGIEQNKDDLFAIFSAKVRWCDPDVDGFAVQIAPEELTHIEEIRIQSWTPNIKPGVYQQITASKGQEPYFIEFTAA